MRDLGLGIWEDLRQKRLWPVAVALALALVAVPALLLKGEDQRATQVATTTMPKRAQLPILNSDPTSLAGSSKLGTFSSKNPFRSRADQIKAAGSVSLPGAAAASSSPASSGGSLGAGSSGLGGSSGAAGGIGAGPSSGSSSSSSPKSGGGSPSGSSPSGGGSGKSSPSGGGSGSGSVKPPSPGGGSTTARFYTYSVDVEFGRIGAERHYGDVRPLDMLPSASNPVVVYMGQTRDGEAAFLVNRAVSQHGEGRCAPTKRDCNFVYLKPTRDQDDHFFTDIEDRVYHLHLNGVRRRLDARAGASTNSSPPSSKARTKVQAARSRHDVRRTVFDFRIPLITGTRR